MISFIGYISKNVVVGNNTTLNVQLGPGSNALTEVVVVGYGTQKRSDVTGAISSISGADLAQVPASPNVIDQLKGRIAGLDITSNSTTPGATGQIRLRGERSFASTQGNADSQNQPLFVIDGVPFIGGSFNDINQDDIASIDVLKDASATAIYGSRASGGVIIITTKRGKAGRTQVTYSANYGTSKITTEYPFMNGTQYAALKEQSIVGNPSQTTAYPFTSAELAGLANGTSTDWQKFLYRRGFITDNQLSISGGDEKTQFAISGGYHYEKGIQYTQNFDRGSLRANLDHTISKTFKVGLSSFQSLEHTNGVSGLLYNAASLSPLTSAYNADGSVNLLPMVGSVDATKVNPLTLQNNQYIQALNRRIYSNNLIYGEANIFDGFKYHLNASLAYGQNQGNNYSPVGTIQNTNTSNAATSESVSNSENYTWLLENIITYDKTFNQKHHITFTGLYSTEKDHSQNTGISGLGLPADYLQSYNLFYANSVSVSNSQFGYSERGLISYMARAFYGFNDKYLLTATVRRDGSSVLAAGHQYLTYPAFALGWNIAHEDFMKKLTFVNNLKLRAGYGTTADQNVAPYTILGNLSSNAYNFGTSGQNGYLVTNLPNPNLKFEHTNNIDLGLDFGVLNNRITGTVDVYSQRTYDVLQSEALPASNGAQVTTVNAGSSKGKGLEIALSSVNIKGTNGGFNWTTNFNIAFNRNAITALHDNLQQDISNGWFVGQPFNVIYDYKKIGIWQQNEAVLAASYGSRPGQIKIQDVNNDGKIDANDRQILGTYQPQFTSGLTNTFSFKGVDLSFVAFARMGQKVAVTGITADATGSAYPFFNQGRVNQINVNYWTPTNPTNDYPQPDASSSSVVNGSTLQYRDGSFIKMRSINLGYTIPTKYIKGAFSSLRIYATCNNPFIVYSPLVKSGLGIDPEGNGYGNQLAGASGFSANALGRAITVGLANPPARTYSIGVNARF
ncbi:SusC/RagA family TonB-linked outer membrane protein [Mucilaginibacter sp. HMF7410]|uniref:SusC/RagA family TonB-linked outer membrane protein n=1 Tax=Mucilaginibacter arboris TaxID=2682090 RepID=A0A7K1SZQ4_9SPHI|nr:SusC/RagA family TonB-linked outer membrane protein [Mucilaginibacter arboris]